MAHDSEVSIHGHMVLLFLGRGEAEHSGGKYGWIVAREGADKELVEGRRGQGQAVPFQVMSPLPPEDLSHP